MSELKTARNSQSVSAFLDAIEDPQRRADCKAIARIMRAATASKPGMWGTAIVGFGSYDYKYASGRQGSWFVTGFSPRKQAITLYIMPGFRRFERLLANLGRFKTGKSCLYIRSLDDVDRDVLQQLIVESVSHMREKYPQQ